MLTPLVCAVSAGVRQFTPNYQAQKEMMDFSNRSPPSCPEKNSTVTLSFSTVILLKLFFV
jgi:hypothetical protein